MSPKETEEEGEEETEEEGEEETEEEGEEETEEEGEEEEGGVTVEEMQGWLNKLAKIKILKKAPKLPEDLDDAMAKFEAIISPEGIDPATQVGNEKTKRKVYNDVVEFFNSEVDPILNPEEEEVVDDTPDTEEEAAEEAKKVKKTPKAAKAKGARGRTAAYTNDAKITVLKKDNPYREDSSRAARHQVVLNAKTYGEAVKAADKANLGPLGGVVRRAVEKKLIKIS